MSNTSPRQEKNKTKTRPRQDQDKAKTRPRQDQDNTTRHDTTRKTKTVHDRAGRDKAITRSDKTRQDKDKTRQKRQERQDNIRQAPKAGKREM
jgi:hypothetical protein